MNTTSPEAKAYVDDIIASCLAEDGPPCAEAVALLAELVGLLHAHQCMLTEASYTNSRERIELADTLLCLADEVRRIDARLAELAKDDPAGWSYA